MYNDPIADLLTRIRNACHAGHNKVEIPSSKLKVELVKVLQKEGFIRSYELRDAESGRKTLRVMLKYDDNGLPVIRHIKRVSRPGLRRYSKVGNLPRVLNGAGVTILTTNRGLMTDREARRERVSGELLCQLY